MERRPNQVRAFAETTAAIDGGAKRICVTSPTGSGKTLMMTDLALWARIRKWLVVLYTYRRMLFDQTVRHWEAAGIDVGKRASGHFKELHKDVQLCMTQTERSRVYTRQDRNLHDANLVLVDEAHNQKSDSMRQIMADHIEAGATVIGYTATPLDICDLYDELIVAGTVREGFADGYLVPASMFAPDEPDLKHIRQYQVGEDLSEPDNVRAIMRPGVFGRVLTWYRKLNPDGRPTILFGPDVKGSLFFAEQFSKAGIKAAHIDGNDVWIDGEFHESDSLIREQVLNGSQCGDIKVVCNRFVMREGIDAPWLSHGILATVFGSLTSYLQSCGRPLRAADGKDKVTIQDHGGNWWRHGSVNAVREWSLELTNHRVVSERQERIREKLDPHPIACPACAKVRESGRKCPFCGYESHIRSRVVVQVNGDLKPVPGDVLRPRYRRLKTDTAALWLSMYYRMKKAGRTFRQAEGLFCHENGYFPPHTLPLMPREFGDWFRRVEDVPAECLT